jgi:potassium-dependent mechanosensitive channel
MIFREQIKTSFSVFVWVLIVVNVLFLGQLQAEQEQTQPSLQENAALAIDPEKVRGRIQETKEKLEIGESTENEETASQLGVSLSQLQEYNSNLRKMENVYQRQLTAIERRVSLSNEKENLGKRLDSQQGTLISQPPPYNLSRYDSLLDELKTTKQQKQAITIALKSAKRVFEEAKKEFEQAEKNVREATEELQKEGHTDKSLQLSWHLGDITVRAKLAEALLDLQRILVQNTETESSLVQLQKQINQRHVDWMQSKLAFDQGDLDNLLDSLEERRITLQTRINVLREGQQDVEDTWLTAQKEFEGSQGADEITKARAMAFLKAREAWRETYQRVLEQTETILLIQDQEKEFWQRRYALLNKNISLEKLAGWEKQTSDYIKDMERSIQLKEKYQTNLQSQLASIQKQFGNENLDFELKQHVETHADALNKMAERGFEYLSLLQGTRAIGERLQDEINRKQKDTTLKKKIKGVGNVVQNIWEVELLVVDERSITVKKLTIALLILVGGMFLAWLFMYIIIRRFFLKTRLDKGAIAAIEKMLYFFVLIVLLIFALRFVNIPLTVFTFLGGALAIGVGFGTQNLLNNFISGFILLAERPVKIDDLVEVEDNFGIIENIGMRCTRVRTPGNVHILVPNSSFLEKNIINWTLSDQEIRAKVVLAVVYGSDPREVSRLMLRAVHEHTKLLKIPEPIVLFEGLSDNSFQFIVYFWVSMKNLHLLERRIIESDIRFRIVELFREAGILMAYPQGDVQLKTSKPLDLRIVASEDTIAGESGKSAKSRE